MLKELLEFLWKRKYWWLVPMLVILSGFGLLAALSGNTGMAPFIYSLF